MLALALVEEQFPGQKACPPIRPVHPAAAGGRTDWRGLGGRAALPQVAYLGFFGDADVDDMRNTPQLPPMESDGGDRYTGEDAVAEDECEEARVLMAMEARVLRAAG